MLILACLHIYLLNIYACTLIIYTILYTIQEIGVSDSSLTNDNNTTNHIDIKINFTQFIVIRYKYSIIMSTLFGGVRLQGQLYLYNNILTQDILPISLPNWLGETVCLTYLCSINRLIVTHKINDDYSYLSLLLSGQESGQALYSGCSMISNTIYTPTLTTTTSSVSTNIHESYHTTVATPVSPPAPQRDVSSSDIIIQILCDSTNNKMYTLSSNGNLTITDLSPTLQQVRFTRRVLWGEGIPIHSVETYNQYITWLQSYDIHTDIHTTHTTTPTHTTTNIHNNTTNIHTNNTNNMRKTDLINISNEFCKLLAIIATTTGYSNVLFLDPLTGLLAVNMSIIHRSIVILESSTLQRLYR